MLKRGFIGIPFQDEARRGRQAVLVDSDVKAGRADRAGKRAIQGSPLGRRRRLHDKTHRSGGGFTMSRLTQKQERSRRFVGATMQPAGGGEIQKRRIAAKLQDDGGKRLQRRCLLRDP